MKSSLFFKNQQAGEGQVLFAGAQGPACSVGLVGLRWFFYLLAVAGADRCCGVGVSLSPVPPRLLGLLFRAWPFFSPFLFSLWCARRGGGISTVVLHFVFSQPAQQNEAPNRTEDHQPVHALPKPPRLGSRHHQSAQEGHCRRCNPG